MWFLNKKRIHKIMYKAQHSTHSSKKVTNHAKAKASSKKSKAKESGKSAGKKTNSEGIFGTKACQIYGIILILFSLLLAVSLVSTCIHHAEDLSYISSATTPGNVAGSVGAHIAHIFVDSCMGIFAIGFAFLFFLYGLNLTFKKKPLHLVRTTLTTLLTMAWLSITMGVGLVLFHSDAEFLAGTFGVYFSDLLISYTGKIVAVLIVAALLLILLILCYNVSIECLLSFFSKKDKESDKKEDADNQKKSNKNGLFSFLKKNKKDAPKFEPQTEDTKLGDQYISNLNELSDEYRGKVFTFDEPEKQQVAPEPMTEQEDIFQPKLVESNKKVYDEVPFDIKIADGGNDANVEDIFPDDESSDMETTENEEVAKDSQVPQEPLEDYDPRKDLSFYEFPSLDLLEDYPNKEASEDQMRKELTEKKVRIEQTLNNFGISIQNITATVGPTVTLYEIVPAPGVRISKIKNLEDDIALSLSALGIRIIAPIPGRGTIGIEVPNKTPNIVSMKEVLSSDKFKNNKFALPIALGKTISNEPFVVDLAKMPHVLMAGATGQGKSVGLNAVITSLLYTKHPSELKFVLVDPKKVEFTLYAAIENHYLAKLPDVDKAIITDTKKVVRTLNSLCVEMDQRYDLLELAKTRNIKEYNAKFCARKLSPAAGHRYLPYIVLIIDEFGDLIMTAGRDVEMPIARLAQLARAVGIHLVIATQRPSVNIITGTIKANFPARIAFRVTSVVDSRTILDGSGANQLIGKGDMLISTGSDLIRLQCAFVDTPEVERIANFIEEQQAYPEPFYLPDVPDTSDDRSADSDSEDFNSDEIDPFFMDAATLVVQTQQGSTSSIQRKLKLGYNRAGRIMDQLEEFGIVGPAERAGKPRDVKVKTTEELQAILQRMGLLD